MLILTPNKGEHAGRTLTAEKRTWSTTFNRPTYLFRDDRGHEFYGYPENLWAACETTFADLRDRLETAFQK